MMEEQGGYYAVIPATILNDTELTATEKLLYGHISRLASSTGYCYASNSYLTKLLEVSQSTVNRGIAKLLKKGYLKYEYEYEPGTKEIKERHLFIGIVTNDNRYCHPRQGGIVTNDKESNKRVEIDSKSKNIDSENKEESKKINNTKRFTKPSKEDIREYLSEIGADSEEADEIFDYYESKGWMIGKSPMKDWKSAVRRWARNNKNWQKKTNAPDFTLKRKERVFSAEEQEILRRLHEGET